MPDLPGNPENPRRVTIVERDGRAPFPTRRVYRVRGVEAGDLRGHHAHETTRQRTVAANGAFAVVLEDGRDQRTYVPGFPCRSRLSP